ncbi:hypothetical protein [Candidatus Palauibacter sp.]|uniref:hypothetical protein n=1 Tax=Candidatus Palauibacter sp. TaxID=3101350 RepID=UPI003B52913B
MAPPPFDPHQDPRAAGARGRGLRIEASPRDLIRDYLLQRVEHGMVRNRADVASALRTIERDTEEATGKVRELLVEAWLRPLIVGLSLWLGTFGGSWATMRWLSRSIQHRIETVAGLNRDIEDARRTLAQLEVDTWGLAFREIKGERFVVVPDGVLARPPWWVDDRPALKLSNE